MAKTTFVVSFGEGVSQDSGVVVELEPSMNVGEDGAEKTSFAPGDEVYFTVHYPASLRVGSVATTSGEAYKVGRGEFNREQAGIFFVDPDTSVSLQHTPSSPLTFFWFGKVGQLDINGREMKAVNAPCVGDVSYKIVADLYRYVPPAIMPLNTDNRFISGVVINMESA